MSAPPEPPVIHHFDGDRVYAPDDPALAVIATYNTLKVWRSQGRGPCYLKGERSVLYRGSELNRWLAENYVEIDPATQRRPPPNERGPLPE